MTMDTGIHMIMITNILMTTGMIMATTTITIMSMSMDPAAVATNLTITVNTNWRTTMHLIHMKRIWPVIRTTANVLPAIPMKSIAITAAKAWPTANAVCRMPTT